MYLGLKMFSDERLKKKLVKLAKDLANKNGESIPVSSQDWSSTKAAYRFLSNGKFSEYDILKVHFNSTINRINEIDGIILILHDTTEVNLIRKNVDDIGRTRQFSIRKSFKDKIKNRVQCGIFLHPSLAITTEGLLLGLTCAKFWSRKKFKGAKTLYRSKNATRIPLEEKESSRWIVSVPQKILTDKFYLNFNEFKARKYLS